MSAEALVIAALGLLGALLSMVGLRLAVQLRRMRSRLLAELEVREKLTSQVGELGAVRSRAAEARDAAEGLRRDLSQSKGEVSALRDQVERVKMDLLRANAVASDAMSKRIELEARVASLYSAAEVTERRLQEHADLVVQARDEASAAVERASRFETQLLDAQRKLAQSQADAAKLSKSAGRAEMDAKAASAASEEVRSLRAELERAKSALAEADAKQKKALEAAQGEARRLQGELEQVKAKLAEEAQKREEAERRVSSGSIPPPMGGAKGGGSPVVAALDSDPALNRGQRETLRMMYDKFTAKTGKA
jgi:chromosome segregation ATPase